MNPIFKLYKKPISLVLLLLIAFLLCPFSISANENFEEFANGTCGAEVSWHLYQTDSGARLFIEGNGKMKDYLDEELMDLDMDPVLAPWSEYNNLITTVEIDEGITHIGGGSFYDEGNIQSVIIPDTVGSIGDYAFFGCNGLTEILLPNSLQEIGYYVFAHSGLQNVTIPSNLSRIEISSFSACESLAEINILPGVSEIGRGAFLGCISLTNVVIPDGLTSIEANSFYSCPALERIEIPASVTEIGGKRQNAVFGLSDKVTIYGHKNSPAYEYAKKYALPFFDVDDETYLVTNMQLSESFITLGTESSAQLQAITDSDQAEVIWNSENPQIASVDETGVVTANKYGTTTITASLKEDSSISASCKVSTLYFDVTDPGQYYFKPVYWASSSAIASGFEGGVYFGPELECNRKQMAILLWNMAGKPTENGRLPFSDTSYSRSSASYKAILWAYKNGIVSGFRDGTFRPNLPITRKQTLLMLYRFAGRPIVTEQVMFSDVTANPSTDSYKAVLWGIESNITKGYSDGKFRPNNTCLRKQIITFLYRMNKIYNYK